MSPAKAGLLVGVLALLLVVYLGLEWRAERVEERASAEKRVLSLAAVDVTGVTVERPGAPAIRIVRESGRWQIVSPTRLRTDDVNARRIVDALTGAERQRVLEGVSAEAPEYGLAAPSLTVTLDSAKGSEALAFGASAPVGGGVYARRPGAAAVLVLPAHVKADAGQSLFDLRDKRILDLSADAVSRMEVRPGKGTGRPSLVLVRQGTGWTVEGVPEGRDVDPYKVERVVEAVTGMQMTAVASEAGSGPTPRGLATPARRVTLALAGGETRTVTVGDAMGSDRTLVRVEGDPATYLVLTAALDPLAQKPADLLEPPRAPSPPAAASPAASP